MDASLRKYLKDAHACNFIDMGSDHRTVSVRLRFGADIKQSKKKSWLLSGLISGGFPTQAVLYEDRKVIDLRCQWCLQEPGTQMHRLYRCPAHCATRRMLDEEWVQSVAADPDADLIFLTRGLVPSPEAARPALVQHEMARWERK